MTKKGNSFVFFFVLRPSPLILLFTSPVQARREAQDEPEFTGCAVRALASSHPAGSFEHRRAPILVFYMGGHVGYPFFW